MVENILIEVTIQLLSTLVGVLVGFVVAMTWDRKKKHEEIQETKNHIIDALIEELKTIQNGFSDKEKIGNMRWNGTKHEFQGSFPIMSTPAYESAINSGNFSLLSTPLQTEVGTLYLAIHCCNSLVEQILKFYTTSIFPTNYGSIEANRLCDDGNPRMFKILDGIKELLPKLESAKES